jgi:hypothetical protein
MKRLLRVLVKTVSLPFVLFAFIGLYFMSLCFVFQEWLFENPDRFYTYKEHHADMKKDIKNYFKNFFR